MSNTKFTGLKGKDFLRALKPFICLKLPKLNQALSEGHGKWAAEERRFVFRYAPPSYRREELMLRLFRQEDLSSEETLLLELLEELGLPADAHRGVRSAGAWDAIGSTTTTTSLAGRPRALPAGLVDGVREAKRTHSGIEIIFPAAEAPEEAPAAAGWGRPVSTRAQQ